MLRSVSYAACLRQAGRTGVRGKEVTSEMYPQRSAGFTLVELVVTMVVVGVLAAVAVPMLSGTQVYDQLSFSDGTLTLLQYAQKSAIAKRRQVCATFSATKVTLMYSSAFGSAACDAQLIGPGGETPYSLLANGTVTYSPQPADFNFNALGQASIPQTINFAPVARPITVEADTGYVHY
jgi:MSHA pilin protein MshC